MNWFLNISTRAKLSLGFGLMIVFLATVIAVTYINLIEVQSSQTTLYERDFKIVENLLALRSDQNRTRALILDMMMTTKRSEQVELKQQIINRKAEIDSALNQTIVLSQDDPQFLVKLKDLKTKIEEYRQGRDQQFDYIFQGKLDEAKQLGLGIQMERFEKIRSIAIELGERAKQDAASAMQKSEQTVNSTIRISGIIGGIAMLLGIMITILLNRIIANPLTKISGIADLIASGELNIDMASDHRTDEVGKLTQAFNRMIRSLKGMANIAQQIAAGNLTVSIKPQSEKDILGNAFATMVGNLSRITKEILEGVNVLGSSASEILATTTQIASSAAETSTAVSETTTTVEEVKQTAQVSTQKAKYVSETSQKVAQVSQTGKKSVEESINVMNKIREQMESVAESIVKLSEQSQAIGEIIATVNDLADQSNLLAVNAAIEAAKAGEQGKGFTVVAQEVKSLAEQSKQATAQVRAILGDIQKAMSAAVMATEQGTKAVEAGVKQSTEAGESIRVLADSITESAQAATQIAASSQQQLVGMDQVALAMENIKQASSQNVTGTKQAEAAARSLHNLGQKLKELVEQYKV